MILKDTRNNKAKKHNGKTRNKRDMLLQVFKDYALCHLLFALGLFFTKGYIVKFSSYMLNVTKESRTYDILKFLIYIILTFLWTYSTFTLTRKKLYFSKTGRHFRKDHRRYKRGYFELMEFFQNADPHRLDTTIFPEQTWNTTRAIIFGTYGNKLISIPSDSECNIAVFGPPGSGKTSGIAIINAMQFKGSVLAVDIKGDLYHYVSKHSKRKILRFCPDNPDALKESCHFNPFSEIDKMDMTAKKLYLKSIATILIPDEGGSDGNYFSSRARKILQGITHLILHRTPDANFPFVIHSILQGNIFDWVTESMNSDCIASKELLASFHGNSEKNVTSAYDALTTALVCFSNPILDELLNNKGQCISIRDLEEGRDIYLQIAQENLDAYAPLFTLIMQSFSTAFTKRFDTSIGVKNRPILMLMDEFPQLTFSYELINSNLSTLRSKSIICMMIQQNLSQLQQRYSENGTRSIMGNCNYHIILGSNDINSSKLFSDTFGSRKVLKISNSETMSQNNSASQSVQEATEKIFPPEYFGDLAAQNKMIMYFKGKYCECEKLNCYKQKRKGD